MSFVRLGHEVDRLLFVSIIVRHQTGSSPMALPSLNAHTVLRFVLLFVLPGRVSTQPMSIGQALSEDVWFADCIRYCQLLVPT